jgi:hypothetical protein
MFVCCADLLQGLNDMPDMDGWQFLGTFEKLPKPTKAPCRVYMLSSSVRSASKLKAESIQRVRGNFNKPLKGFHLQEIFS